MLQDSSLVCTSCARKFGIEGNLIDLRPRSVVQISKQNEVAIEYDEIYQNLVNSGSLGKDRAPFGLISKSVSPGFFKETISFLRKRISKDLVVCDVGAGSGDYSVELARSCKFMFHCDLDLEGISLAQKNAEEKGLDNILFLRCNYFRLPFLPHVLDLAYTIDVLERGEEHDKVLLQEIVHVLKNDGLLCFDCHSKERTRLTRVPSSSNRYFKEEVQTLVNNFSLKLTEITGTGFIPQVRIWSETEYRFLNMLAKMFRFPPARWLLSCRLS